MENQNNLEETDEQILLKGSLDQWQSQTQDNHDLDCTDGVMQKTQTSIQGKKEAQIAEAYQNYYKTYWCLTYTTYIFIALMLLGFIGLVWVMIILRKDEEKFSRFVENANMAEDEEAQFQTSIEMAKQIPMYYYYGLIGIMITYIICCLQLQQSIDSQQEQEINDKKRNFLIAFVIIVVVEILLSLAIKQFWAKILDLTIMIIGVYVFYYMIGQHQENLEKMTNLQNTSEFETTS